ncbi:hypothetical protein F5Y05DRAFT_390853 [Hypoxylon sp. FL0543]|nr:hypothetical protein F5Y05DRAFT_390853 [Hypoxylon sp. FL0543]
MVKVRPGKQAASPAGMPWPDPVAKRAKMALEKEKEEDQGPNFRSIPKYEDAQQAHDDDLGGKILGFGIDSGLDGSTRSRSPEKKALTLKDLETIYSPEFIKEVTAPNLGGSHGSRNAQANNAITDVVYVVTHAKSGQWTDPEFDVVGTYGSAEAANLRVLSLFEEMYSEITQQWNYKPSDGSSHRFSYLDEEQTVKKAKGQPKDAETNWWISNDGALSLWANSEAEFYRICATKQVVGTDGLAEGKLNSVSSQ